MGYFYLFNFGMNITMGVLRGIRKSTMPMLSTLIFCTGLRILLILTVFPLEQFHTLAWLYALFPITWFLAFLSNTVALIIFLPKALRKIDVQPAEENA